MDNNGNQTETNNSQGSFGLHLFWISGMPLESLLHGASWLNVTQELRKIGWKVTLISPGFSGVKKIRNIEVFGIKRPEIFILRQIIYQFKFIKLILRSKNPIDVVLFGEMEAISISLLSIYRKILNKQRPLFIMDTRSLPMTPQEKLRFRDHIRGAYFSSINWLTNRIGDGRTAITNRIAESLRIPAKKLIGIWPSGVDLKPFSTRPYGYLDEEPINTVQLIYIGSMNYERNLMTLSKAVYDATQQGMSFELRIVGDGSEFGDLKKYSMTTNSVVKVLPPIPHSEIAVWLQKSHIGVLPFPDEEKFRVSSPIKLFEYMAAGLPVMATEIVCHTDVVDEGKYVFWVNGSTCEDFIKTLELIWRKKENFKEMGEMAKDAVVDWTWQVSAMKLNQALVLAIEKREQIFFRQ